MLKLRFARTSMVISAMFLTACQINNRDIGSVFGGVIGGGIGSQVGKGNGALVATATGTFFGALIGGGIVDRLEAYQKLEIKRTTSYALDRNPDGLGARWRDTKTNVVSTITPMNSNRNPQGVYCREFRQTLTIGGTKQQGYGTACRQTDGSWKIVN